MKKITKIIAERFIKNKNISRVRLKARSTKDRLTVTLYPTLLLCEEVHNAEMRKASDVKPRTKCGATSKVRSTKDQYAETGTLYSTPK